jgi:eukaryotic-like serine/threonine-protein kinase
MNAIGTASSEVFEEVLVEFEESWRSGRAPDLAEFLSRSSIGGDGDPSAARVDLLLDLVLVDMEYRWREPSSRLNGAFPARPRLDHYLARYPELTRPAGVPLVLIGAEYRIRQLWGDRPDSSEYLARFPSSAATLREELRQIDAEIARECPEPDAEASTWPVVPSGSTASPMGLSPAIDGFEILGELGRGGMSVVYKARERKLGRLVAIKMMAEDRSADIEHLERFRAEAQAVARLRHANIIAIHAIGEHKNHPYLSLEFAEGGNLAQRLAEKPMTPRESAELLETLARAVHAAHQAGVVHRDLKPSNIVFAAEGAPKVSDFGLAKLLDADSGRTLSGQPIGTPSYMAPEQAGGDSKRAGTAADVYALGAILYHALTGRPPFLGESHLETMRMVVSTEAVAPRGLRPDVPRDLETICLRCLEKEPSKRYAGATELADELRRYLDGRPIIARPVGPAGRFVRWSRRNPWIAGLSAAVLVSLVVGTVASTVQAIRAGRAEVATGRQRDRAEQEAGRFKAISDFLRNDLLAQASAYNQPGRAAAPDPDLTVRTVLDRAAEKIGDQFAGQPLVEAAIRQTIGDTYSQLGLLALARPHLERALDLRRAALGDQDPETLSTMISLGMLHDDHGNWTEAERFLAPAVEGLRKTKGPDSLETLQAMTNLGGIYMQLEKTKEAEDLLSRAVEGSQRTRGHHDGVTLRAMDGLAVFYTGQNRLEQAEQLEETVVKEMQAALGAESPDTLAARRNLAIIYDARGKVREAEDLFKNVLKDMRRILGDRHPMTVFTLANIANHYLKLQNMDELEKYANEALEGSRVWLNDNHEVRIFALTALANVYRRRGDVERLERVLLESVELTRSRYGPDGGLAAGANGAAGSVFISMGEYARAEPYCRKAWAFNVTHEPNGMHRTRTELHLGVALLGLGQRRWDEARRHLLTACNRLEPARDRALPEDTSSLTRIVGRLTGLVDDKGNPLQDVTLAKLRGDPKLQVIWDLEFPADPFARR